MREYIMFGLSPIELIIFAVVSLGFVGGVVAAFVLLVKAAKRP
jgi:hypothetical protein